MGDLMSLKNISHVRCKLLAVNYTVEADIPALRLLCGLYPDILTTDFVLKLILTFLPETTEPLAYAQFTQDIALRVKHINVDRIEIDSQNIKTYGVEKLTEKAAAKALNGITFLSIVPESIAKFAKLDCFTQFLINRAFQLDRAGLLAFSVQLVQQFLQHSKFLKLWYLTYILPLSRLTLKFYPTTSEWLFLRDFCQCDSKESINFLLKNALLNMDADTRHDALLVRDLRSLIGPWIIGRSKLTKWTEDSDVESEDLDAILRSNWSLTFNWLEDACNKDYLAVGHAINVWSGVYDVDLGDFDDEFHQIQSECNLSNYNSLFCSALMRMVYKAPANTEQRLACSSSLMKKIESLGQVCVVEKTIFGVEFVQISPDNICLKESLGLHGDKDILHDVITQGSYDAIAFLKANLLSAKIFFGYERSVVSILPILRLRSQASAVEQKEILDALMETVLQISKGWTDSDWLKLREELTWLRRWTNDTCREDYCFGVFGAVSRVELERKILRTSLHAGKLTFAIQYYLGEEFTKSFISREDVEKTVALTINECLDGMTNGNVNSVGMKKAHELLSVFEVYFPDSVELSKCKTTITICHALSGYNLTIDEVNFKPRILRCIGDPLTIIERVLQQNPKAYRQLDELIDIGRMMVGLRSVMELEGNGVGRGGGG